MKKQIICLSGWGQKYDSLEFMFLRSEFADFEVISLDYSLFDSVERFFAYVESLDLRPELIVGWSLGGQLALRLVKEGILRPKKGCVLLAPPFQMVKDARIQAAMVREVYDEFYANFKAAPSKVLQKFAILTAMNDKNASEIARGLEISEENHDNLVFWLEELERFSFFDFDFSNVGKVLFFQGRGDMIVHESQVSYFGERIADFSLKMMDGCGHAPHLSDLGVVLAGVLGFLRGEEGS